MTFMTTQTPRGQPESVASPQQVEDKHNEKWNSLNFEATGTYSQVQISDNAYEEESEEDSEEAE
jgi:hypothetical protein